jgi:REP element-mobilizing transposase RayT
MSYKEMWVHVVWATKNLNNLITCSFKKDLFDHIKESCELKGINIDSINGTENHIHCLIKMDVNQSFKSILQHLKGESAYWTNNIYKKLDSPFYWQSKYYVTSVSTCQINNLRKYIKEQDKIHKKLPYLDEVKKIFNQPS